MSQFSLPKSGRFCTFDSALLTVHDVDAVMDRCYKGMKVADIAGIIDAVKAPVDDMTPDELRIYNRIIKEMRKRGEQWAKDIYSGEKPMTELNDVIAPVLQTELGTTMGKRLDALGAEFSIPMTTDDRPRIMLFCPPSPKSTPVAKPTPADPRMMGMFITLDQKPNFSWHIRWRMDRLSAFSASSFKSVSSVASYCISLIIILYIVI